MQPKSQQIKTKESPKEKKISEESLVVKTTLQALKRLPKPKDVNEERLIVKTALAVLKRVPKPKDGKDGVDGKDGKDADEEVIVKKVLERVPKTKEIDTEKLERSILSKVPKNDALLQKLTDLEEKQNTELPKAFKDIKEVRLSMKDVFKRLSFNSASQTTSFGGEVTKLSQLTDDVKITSPSNGQALVYDSTQSKWVNGSAGVPSTRTINTTLPLAGGGDLSADRTFSLGGLSTLGTANYLVGVNAGATAWEYKQLIQGSNITITQGVGSITIAGTGGGNTVGWIAETPIGTVNGSNVTFTLSNSPANVNSVLIVLDGVTQYNGIDYTVSGTTVTFTVAPQTGSTIFTYYSTVTSSGTGTVTSVSVVTANGVSGSVANPTTTPAITLTLGAITPSSVASAGAVSGTTGTFMAGNALTLGTASANAGAIRFRNATNGNLLTLVSGATGSALSFTLPTADGSPGQFLKTDGSGVLSFATAGGGTPGGSNTQIQYNNSGAFGGLSNVLSTNGADFTQVGITLGSDATNDMYFRNSSGLLARIASANSAILKTDGSGVQSFSTTLPTAVQDNITRLGRIATYGGLGTAGGGNGVATIVAYQRAPGIGNAPSGNIAGFTPGADGTFLVSANVNVTTSVNHSFTVTCSYTDEQNAARVLTLTFSTVAGVLFTALTNAVGVGAYSSIPFHIRAKGGAAITFQTGGVNNYTNVVYNIEAQITKIA